MTESGNDTKLYRIEQMRMNSDKLNTGMMRGGDVAKEGQIKFSVGIFNTKTVKSLCPICSHSICEHNHSFLNATTGNVQFKRTKTEVLTPQSKQKKG